ncbi:MAG: helix-turn-helix transcriptional regulator [Elusimicrobia bacterium]|nr:helix-turn-helix transcriptional regulator [Elusimicrobiota bacterium]
MKNLTSIKEPKEIGILIRQIRKKNDLKQAEAAAICGVGTRFLSDLENGKSSLHLGKTLQVLKTFGLVVLIKKKELTDG